MYDRCDSGCDGHAPLGVPRADGYVADLGEASDDQYGPLDRRAVPFNTW